MAPVFQARKASLASINTPNRLSQGKSTPSLRNAQAHAGPQIQKTVRIDFVRGVYNLGNEHFLEGAGAKDVEKAAIQELDFSNCPVSANSKCVWYVHKMENLTLSTYVTVEAHAGGQQKFMLFLGG